MIEIEENIGIKFMHTERQTRDGNGMSFLSAQITDDAMTDNSQVAANDKEENRSSINEILLSSNSLNDIDAYSDNSSVRMERKHQQQITKLSNNE